MQFYCGAPPRPVRDERALKKNCLRRKKMYNMFTALTEAKFFRRVDPSGAVITQLTKNGQLLEKAIWCLRNEQGFSRECPPLHYEKLEQTVYRPPNVSWPYFWP